jgi:branched-chain amino acid transport system permease protein
MFPESLRWSSLRVILGVVICIGLLLLPVISHWLEQSYYLSFATRIVIYAIAATGLNLILGYAGMVSLGHALFVAIGAYVVGICSFHGVTNGWVQLAIALGLTIVISSITGLVSLRTRGIGFIMITLAFAQMFYFFTVSLKQYGGDDGLPIDTHSAFAPLPSIDNKYVLYYLALGILFVAMYLVWRMVHSRFGYVLRGFKSNERRMLAAGFPRLRYQLAAYVVSAVICTLSGILLANLTMFASPSYLSWQASGDLILIVVLGGMGTVMGPLAGTVVFLILEEVLSALTQHWMAVLGIFILAIALYARRGVWGGLTQFLKGTQAADKEKKND